MLTDFRKKNAQESAARQERRRLIKEIHEINRKMACAYVQFNLESDEDLIDSVIFRMQSLSARYRYLLRRVREENPTRQEQGELIRVNRAVNGEWG